MPADKASSNGWYAGFPAASDRAHCIDVAPLFAFLQASQLDTLAKLNSSNDGDAKNMTR